MNSIKFYKYNRFKKIIITIKCINLSFIPIIYNIHNLNSVTAHAARNKTRELILLARKYSCEISVARQG